MKYEIINNGHSISFYRLSEKENGGITHIFEWGALDDYYITAALKGRERDLAEKYMKELSAEVLQELNRTAVSRKALQKLFNFLKGE